MWLHSVESPAYADDAVCQTQPESVLRRTYRGPEKGEGYVGRVGRLAQATIFQV